MHLFRQSLIFWLVCTQVRKADPVCQGGFVTPTAVLFQVEKDAGRVVSAVSAYWHLEGHFLNIYIFESRIYWSSRLIVHLFKLCKTADLALFAVALLSGFYSPATEAVGPKPFSWNGRVWDAKPRRLLHRFLRLIGWGLFWMWLGSGRYANVLLTVPGDGSCVAVSLTRPPLWRHYCLLIPKVLKKRRTDFEGQSVCVPFIRMFASWRLDLRALSLLFTSWLSMPSFVVIIVVKCEVHLLLVSISS